MDKEKIVKHINGIWDYVDEIDVENSSKSEITMSLNAVLRGLKQLQNLLDE